MKRIILAIVSLLIVVTYASATPKAPKYKNKQLALFSYDFSTDQNMLAQLNQHLSLFEKDTKVDPVEKALRNRIFDLIKNRLESEIGLSMLPVESFQGAISYNKFGFPSDNIGKAIRVGSSKLYFKLDVTVYSGSDIREKSKKDQAGEKDFRPTVSITITIFNNKGIIPIDKFQGVGNAKEALPSDATLLNGIVNDEPIDGKNSFMGLANEAVSDLIINFL